MRNDLTQRLKRIVQTVHTHAFPLVRLETPQITLLGIQCALATSIRIRTGIGVATGVGRQARSANAIRIGSAAAAAAATDAVRLPAAARRSLAAKQVARLIAAVVVGAAAAAVAAATAAAGVVALRTGVGHFQIVGVIA